MNEITPQVIVLSGYSPVIVFEGTGKVNITSTGSVYFGGSNIDDHGAGDPDGSFGQLVGNTSGTAEFCSPTRIYACRHFDQPAPTVKVRNWF